MQQFKLPEIKGKFPTAERIIYFSCDEVYYKEYGLALIKSIVHQIPWIHVHCHVIQKQEVFPKYKHKNVTHTWEVIGPEFISNIPVKSLKSRVSKSVLDVTPEIIYYACTRFMQIDKIFNYNCRLFQVDCDTILFNPFAQVDFDNLTNHVRGMRKPKTPEKIIASAISFGAGEGGIDFRKRIATEMFDAFSKGCYWFIDQEVLQDIFLDIEFHAIPLVWNHWSFKKPGGFFRTGKGRKKDNPVFQFHVNRWKNMD